jgi:hypothetical protein
MEVGHQPLGQRLRRHVCGVEQLQPPGGDLHRPQPTIPGDGLAYGQPFAFQIVHDPHDSGLVGTCGFRQVPLRGGPAVGQYDQNGEVPQLDAEWPNGLRHHCRRVPVCPAQQQSERERGCVARPVGRAGSGRLLVGVGGHGATLADFRIARYGID